MSKPPQFRSLSEEMAIALMPLAILFATSVSWMIYRQSNTSLDALLFHCLIGVLLLSVLLGKGFRYYMEHPFVGLLTALTLLSLFPVSHASISNDAWQFGFGLVTGLGGGALTITFLILSLKSMNRGGEKGPSVEALDDPNAPEARWHLASGGSEGSHRVRNVD